MREYTFKPAPVRKPQTWAIKDHHLLRRGASAALNLSEVTSASWNTVTYRGTRSAWLHLNVGKETTKIECNDSGGSREEFLALVVAISQSLRAVNPDLKIEFGYSAPWRMALFILGVLGTLGGLFLIYAGLTDMTGKGAVEATISGGAIVILLFPVAWTCRPNMNATTISPEGLATQIALLGGPTMDDPNDGASQN